MENILILGGGLQGLSCGDSLSHKGFIVDVMSSELQIKKSKFFNRTYACSLNLSIKELSSILDKNHYDVIFPMSDKFVSLLSKNKDFLEKKYGVKCACPNYDTLSIVENKHLFMMFCSQKNIPHPKTLPINNENFEDCAIHIGFPSLIKPDFSVGARGITKVYSLIELKEKISSVIENYGSCTLQELINNEDYYYNVMLYRNNKGDFPAYTIRKIVRMFPVDAGSSSCLITKDNHELLEICKDCLNKLNWIGMADFDVLQRQDNKEFKIIEINPRVPASLRAAAISGINFPEIIVLDAMGKTVPNYKYQPGKILRYLGLDIMWFFKAKNRSGAYPHWCHFYGNHIYYQDIYMNDPSTWWTWLIEGISKIKKRNKRIR